MKKILVLVLFFLSSFSTLTGQSNVDSFDKYVEAARQEWNVPGMSITVVQDSKVLFSKGYGTREIGKTAPVNSETLFGAMSTTKAMTVACLAMLVDEGKLNWNDKVLKYLRDFRVGDPYITNDLRVRDLLTHSAGIGDADFLWVWTPDISNAEVLRRMQYAQTAYSPRTSFIYQNIMYLVAGQILEKVSGMPWERFVAERLFTRLGMKNTFADLSLSKNYSNRSASHFEINERIQVIPEMPADSIAPAGAVWSTADDIAKWVTFMLGDGTYNGITLIKPGTMNEIFKPQVIVPAPQFYPTIAITKPHWLTYGFGWFQHDYRGEMVNFHTGSLAGRTAIIGLLRDKKLGIYIFGNLDHAELRHALMYKAFDLFAFGDNSRDWSKDAKTLYDGLRAAAKKRADELKAKRIPNTSPSLDLASYAGTYSDPLYGKMEVILTGGKLRLVITKDVSAQLDHWHLDTFQAVWSKTWWGEDAVSFQLDPTTGTVDSINVSGAVLKRVPKAN